MFPSGHFLTPIDPLQNEKCFFYFVRDRSEVLDLLLFTFLTLLLKSSYFMSAVSIIFLHKMDGLLLKFDMTIFFSGNFSGVRISSGFFPDFLQILTFLQFWPVLLNWWFTSQIWYDNLPYLNFIRFSDFPYFSVFIRISLDFLDFTIS